MSRAQRITAVIIALAVVAGGVGVLWLRHPSPSQSLSLVFERYSTRTDLFLQDMAFLWITNSSDKAYLLPMAGGTDTFQMDAPVGFGSFKQEVSGSYLVDYEFSGKRPQPVNPMLGGRALSLDPHSALRLRIPLPPGGATDKVAVLVWEQPSGPSPFWRSRIGRSFLAMLPKSAARGVLSPQPTVLRVWCDHELSQPARPIRK